MRDVAGEVAGLVDQVDEVLSDQAACGVDHRQRQLLGKMVSEGPLGRNEGFQVVGAVLMAGASGSGPIGVTARHLGAIRRRRGSTAPRAFGGGNFSSLSVCETIRRRSRAVRRGRTIVGLALPGALEQRVAL